MWPLNATSLHLEVFLEKQVPRYAILSHRWGNEEVSFADIRRSNDREILYRKAGYQKILDACQQAINDQLEWVWIDTCCIDKSSSAELQEAINSMFRWYMGASICYAYLADVSFSAEELESAALQRPKFWDSLHDFGRRLALSKWFHRGWTLQELIAPMYVEFFTNTWRHLGSKEDLAFLVQSITRVDIDVLAHKTPHSGVSVAKRLSWAATRVTSRTEDQAYCLLGLLDINMPLLYGEGSRAFRRLQEEVIRTTDDESIIAWGFWHGAIPPSFFGDAEPSLMQEIREHAPYLLANSPRDFAMSGNVISWRSGNRYQLTNRVLQAEMPVVEF